MVTSPTIVAFSATKQSFDICGDFPLTDFITGINSIFYLKYDNKFDFFEADTRACLTLLNTAQLRLPFTYFTP